MSKLIIHAGLGKTATSAIQNYAYKNLTQSSELLYTRIGLIDECHNAFCDSHPRFKRDRFKTDINSLHKLLKTNANKSVLVSSEFFVNTSLENTKLLVEPLTNDGISVVIVIVIRNYVDLMLSAYLQALKTGYGLNHGESALDYADRNINIFRVGYQLSRWNNVRHSSIAVIDYDSHKKNIVQYFFSLCGLPGIDCENHNINPSLLPEFISIIRNYDKSFAETDNYRRKRLIDTLMDLSVKYRDVSYRGDIINSIRNKFFGMYEDDILRAKAVYPEVEYHIDDNTGEL